MGENTIGLKKEQAQASLNFDAHYGEVHGTDDDVRYVQGHNFYGHQGQFLREAPKTQWLTPLTQEQEDNRRRQMQANKKFFAASKPRVNDTGVPQSVMNAERENSRARAAENAA